MLVFTVSLFVTLRPLFKVTQFFCCFELGTTPFLVRFVNENLVLDSEDTFEKATLVLLVMPVSKKSFTLFGCAIKGFWTPNSGSEGSNAYHGAYMVPSNFGPQLSSTSNL